MQKHIFVALYQTLFNLFGGVIFKKTTFQINISLFLAVVKSVLTSVKTVLTTVNTVLTTVNTVLANVKRIFNTVKYV